MKRSAVAAAASTLTALSFLCLSSTAAWADPPGTVTGKVQQPIIAGDPVNAARQREMGLVVVSDSGGTCSGTLLNRYWVLTADHCVSNDGKVGGPDQPPANISVSAAWSKRAPTATRYVRFSDGRNLDVALIYLGAGDLGPVDRNLIYHNQVDTSMTLTKFGRGICAYATGSGNTAQPARANCGYLSVRLTPYDANATVIKYRPNDGKMASFGDSGGPDFVTDGYGNLLGIASVTSSGEADYLPGKPESAQWVTKEIRGTSAALLTIRDDIHRVIAERPYQAKGPGGPGSASTSRDDRNPYGAYKGSADSGLITRDDRNPNESYKGPVGGASITRNDATVSSTTCRSGYVWREAGPSDLVCVTPDARARTRRENTEAAGRIDPYGAYGPRSCIAGYVWREAFQGDLVCVTPAVRDIARQENAAAASHMQ